MMDKSHAAAHSTTWRNFDCLRVNARPADNPDGSFPLCSVALDFFSRSNSFVKFKSTVCYFYSFCRRRR